MSRRRYGSKPKHTEQDILTAFIQDARKKQYGNYRIQDNTLVYRCQSSEEISRPDNDKFNDWYTETGARIRDLDGQLVVTDTNDEGKPTSTPVLLESLTKDTVPRGLRIQFYETNLVAMKVTHNNETVYIGNSSILPLIGRTTAYGRTRENRCNSIEIQDEMRRLSYFHMIPFSQLNHFESNDTITMIERGAGELVTVNMKAKHYPYELERQCVKFAGALLFSHNGNTYLNDLDRVELGKLNYRPVLTQVTATSITDARDEGVPDEVKGCTNTKSINGVYFIPCNTPPVMPVVSQDEAIMLLSAYTGFSLTESMIKHVTGYNKPETTNIRVQGILAKVPKSETFAGVTIEQSIEINGKWYCKGKAESKDCIDLELNKWHTLVSTVE